MYYNKKRILICAHRGGCAHAPENTLPAFKSAMEMGADLAELDLNITRDGTLVLLHDDTLKRTTGVDKTVSALTLAEIKQLDAGKFFSPNFMETKIPTFDEVLSFVRGNLKILIDMKQTCGHEEIVVQLIQKHRMELDVIAGARSAGSVQRFKTLNPNIKVLGFIPKPAAIDEYLYAGADIIRLWMNWDLPRWVSFLHERGKPAWWCIRSGHQQESPQALEPILQSGIDALILDDIIKIKTWFKFYGK